jgi:hypothetical protein
MTKQEMRFWLKLFQLKQKRPTFVSRLIIMMRFLLCRNDKLVVHQTLNFLHFNWDISH